MFCLPIASVRLPASSDFGTVAVGQLGLITTRNCYMGFHTSNNKKLAWMNADVAHQLEALTKQSPVTDPSQFCRGSGPERPRRISTQRKSPGSLR